MTPQLPRAGLIGILPEQPLAATFSLTGNATREIGPWISAIYRDTDGSVRTEMVIGEKKFVSILDAPGERLIILHDAEHTAVISHYKLDDAGVMWSFDGKPKFTAQHRQIMGLDCHRVILTDPVSAAAQGELWISQSAGIVAEDRQPSSNGGDVVWSATSLVLKAPPETLFKVPDGFETVTQ